MMYKIQQKRNPKRVKVKVRKITDNFLTLERAKKEYGDEYIVTEEEMFGRKCICLMPKDETRAAWENESKSCCVCRENCDCENGTTATNPKQETVERENISYDSLKRKAREYYLPTPVDENSGMTFIIEENSSFIQTAKIEKDSGKIAVFRYYEDGSVKGIFDPAIIAKAVQTLYISFWEQKTACDIKVKDSFDRKKRDFYQNLYSGSYSILEIRCEDEVVKVLNGEKKVAKRCVDVEIKDNGIKVCTITFYEDGRYKIKEANK